MNIKTVKINHDKCLSCYRCISVCPVKYCNDVSGQAIKVHAELCIGCGKCIEVCSHNARIAIDDFETALILTKNEKWTLLVDSSSGASFESNIYKLNAWFKDRGCNQIIETGFGYELCAKQYADYITENPDKKFIISANCPVVVNYIQVYKPELIQYLAPIETPIVIAVNILKEKHKEICDDTFVYFSPCLAANYDFKKIQDSKVYNVTYKKTAMYIDKNEIALNNYEESLFSTSKGVLPIGLSGSWLNKNLRKHLQDSVEIRRITGIHEIIRYLESLDVHDLPRDKTIVLDLLSCKGGCEGGSGSLVGEENPDRLIRRSLKYMEALKERNLVNSNSESIINQYNSIRLDRKFIDRSNFNWLEKPTKSEIERIYVSMYKKSNNDIKNCASCGYHKCERMATAIYNNLNNIENCHFYINEKLSHLAFHDNITGLLNRTAFYSQLEESVNLENKFNIVNERAVFLIDIYGFREINETLGNDVGDEVLVRTATRLRSLLADGDMLFRTGSDEFAIIINHGLTNEEIELYSQNINLLFEPSMYVANNELFLTLNCGAALYPTDGDTAIAVIKNAESALHEAKFERKEFALFTMDMYLRTIERLTFINSMRTALEKKEFELYYQPQFSLNGKLKGAEALIRWNKPGMGIVSPDRFIPLAEDSGLIIPIGEWVIDQVCRDYNHLLGIGIDLPLSANLSVRQFKDTELINKIALMMKKYSIGHNKVHLEITESFIMDNANESVDKLRQLSDLGLKISLDDFGTGYSCLSYLNNLSLDVLKIDKSFIDQIEKTSLSVPLIDTIVSMAMSLGLDIVAEGVSEDYHVEYLKRYEFDMSVQGFYFGRPVPFAAFCSNAVERLRS